jgi:multidrug efflux pump subunit AcrA (membrane-fusion protein)
MPPGLSARCEIFINQVIDTVVVPTVAIFERDSQSVVYVEDKGRFQPIPVKTGLTNGSQSIITSGLTGTETIALEEPPHNRIRLIKQKTHE